MANLTTKYNDQIKQILEERGLSLYNGRSEYVYVDRDSMVNKCPLRQYSENECYEYYINLVRSLFPLTHIAWGLRTDYFIGIEVYDIGDV